MTTGSDIGTTLGGLPMVIDTDARTYEEIRDSVIEGIRGLSAEWTDFYPSDPGVILLEAVSAIAAGVHYQIDRAQNEGYLRTAQQRAAVEEILRLVGYEMQPPTAASVPLVITTTGALVIPKGWGVSAQDGSAVFTLLEAATIPGAGTWRVSDVPELVASAGLLLTESLGTSTGRPRQRVMTSRTDFAVPSTGYPRAVVLVNGSAWSLVETFVDSQPTDEHVRVLYSSTGRAIVAFGDGVRGKIPPLGATLTITAVFGGGALTNSVGTGVLTLATSAVEGLTVVTNEVQPSGGRDAETVDEAKLRAPLAFRAQDRAVSIASGDFTAMAKAASPAVQSARAFRVDDSLALRLAFSVSGDNPVPAGTWFPRLMSGSGMVGLVGRYVARRSTTPIIDVVGAVPVRPVLRVEIRLFPGAVSSEVLRQVDSAVRRTYIDKGSLDSDSMGLSDVVGAIEGVRGVDIVNVLEFRRVPAFQLTRGTRQSFDQATKTVAAVYPTVEQSDYTLHWMTFEVYRLTSSRHGMIRDEDGNPRNFTAGSTHTVILYSKDDPRTAGERWQFDIRVDVGSVRPRRGDTWRFGVDFYAGNLALAPEEVVAPTIVGLGDARRITPGELSITLARR